MGFRAARATTSLAGQHAFQIVNAKTLKILYRVDDAGVTLDLHQLAELRPRSRLPPATGIEAATSVPCPVYDVVVKVP